MQTDGESEGRSDLGAQDVHNGSANAGRLTQQELLKKLAQSIGCQLGMC